jgi:hypothetical protein
MSDNANYTAMMILIVLTMLVMATQVLPYA